MNRTYSNALRVVTEMLLDRGFTIEKCEILELGTLICTSSALFEVMLVAGSQFNTAIVMSLMTLFRERGTTHIILVHAGTATHATKKILGNLSSSFVTELFTYTELQVNIMKHTLVPPHRRITSSECDALLPRFSPHMFPVILSTDAVARYYFYQPLDIIEISRPDGVVVYRNVVAVKC
jgi:DNA-directed RNA polymerase subunit H (RpoH/RPB5)